MVVAGVERADVHGRRDERPGTGTDGDGSTASANTRLSPAARDSRRRSLRPGVGQGDRGSRRQGIRLGFGDQRFVASALHVFWEFRWEWSCATALLLSASIRSTLIALVTLKKIVPNLVQLGDCRFKRQDKELLTLATHETKTIKGLERIGNLEINIDRKVFCEPPLDTLCNVGRCWRYLRLADEMICEGRLLGLLVLGRGDQIVKNARIIIDIAKINIFSELHVILQGLMLIFQPLAHREATERHNPRQGNERLFNVSVF